jgi:hypothetical protein
MAHFVRRPPCPLPLRLPFDRCSKRASHEGGLSPSACSVCRAGHTPQTYNVMRANASFRNAQIVATIRSCSAQMLSSLRPGGAQRPFRHDRHFSEAYSFQGGESRTCTARISTKDVAASGSLLRHIRTELLNLPRSM